MLDPVYMQYLSVIVFCVAIAGIILNLSNIIKVFLCLELMFLAVSLNFIASSYMLGDLNGQVLALFVLTVAAAESAIGLAVLVYYFRVKSNISVEQSDVLRN